MSLATMPVDVEPKTTALIKAIPLGQIAPDPNQPRRSFDEYELGTLAESLKKAGQLTPVQVTQDTEGKGYTLIFGERRWRAAKIAGLKTLKCEVVTAIDAATITVRQLIENRQREAVRPLQEAMAMAELLMRANWTAGKLAIAMGVTVSTVSKAIALTRLDPEVQELIDDGSLSAASGYELSRLRAPELQIELAHLAVTERWTRDMIAKKVTVWKDGEPDARPITPTFPVLEVDTPLELSGLEVDTPHQPAEPTKELPAYKIQPPTACEPETRPETFPGEKPGGESTPAIEPVWSPERHYRFEPFPGCLVTVSLPAHTIDAKQAITDAFEFVMENWDGYELSAMHKKDRGLPPGR